MAAPTPVPRPTWTRRAPGWVFAAFFITLILLTYFAVFYYNRGDLTTTSYFAALASVVPVVLVIAVYYLLPVWALPVPLAVEEVAGALARGTRDLQVEPVEERQGAFARCVAVVRFQAPACTVGWYALGDSPRAAALGARSLVVLHPERRDRRALAAFRETLARILLAGAPAA